MENLLDVPSFGLSAVMAMIINSFGYDSVSTELPMGPGFGEDVFAE